MTLTRIRFVHGSPTHKDPVLIVAKDQTRHYFPAKGGGWNCYERVAGTNIANFLGVRSDKEVTDEQA